MEFPYAKDLDVTSEDLDNLPPGMALSIQPPCQEHMQDRPDRSRPHSGTQNLHAMGPRWNLLVFWTSGHEKAAKEGRLDVVDLLLDMKVECDPKAMKSEGGEDDEEPLLEPEHAYLTAINNGHLDIVKLLVEKGGVPIDYEDKDDGLLHILYAATKRNVEMTRWLLDNGATITLNRTENNVGDVQAALKGGEVVILKMLLAYPPVFAAGVKLTLDDLAVAAVSGDADMVRFVLRSECFGVDDPDAGLIGLGSISLDTEKRGAIFSALEQATNKGSTKCVILLLKQLTSTRPDGTFEPFLVPDNKQIALYNCTVDALDCQDNPELFKILWDTVLHHEPSQESIDLRVALPAEECLNRCLISTAAMGCVNTVRLLLQRYNADINHVSHKYFTTPLGRAASSGANPLPGRLKVVENLCSRPDLNIELASGEFCNGDTALALAVREAYLTRRRKPEHADMVRLLLRFGGPVDEVTDGLRQSIVCATPEKAIKVHVLYGDQERRKPIILSAHRREGYIDGVLKYSARDLRNMLRNVRIRSDDETLRASDPRGRPLMPHEGEEIPEEQRAKQTFMNAES